MGVWLAHRHRRQIAWTASWTPHSPAATGEIYRSLPETSEHTPPPCHRVVFLATTTVELREPRDWDRGFTRTAVFFHKVGVASGSTQTDLKTSPVTEFTDGSVYQDANVAIRVNSINTYPRGGERDRHLLIPPIPQGLTARRRPAGLDRGQ